MKKNQEPAKQKLDLNLISLQLEGLEETIIYHLIERVQYCINSIIYSPGQSGFKGFARKNLWGRRSQFEKGEATSLSLQRPRLLPLLCKPHTGPFVPYRRTRQNGPS